MPFAEQLQMPSRARAGMLFPHGSSTGKPMDIRVLGRKGVAGTLAVVAGAILLALEFHGPGAAILIAGIVDLAVDALSLIARHTRRQWKARRVT